MPPGMKKRLGERRQRKLLFSFSEHITVFHSNTPSGRQAVAATETRGHRSRQATPPLLLVIVQKSWQLHKTSFELFDVRHSRGEGCSASGDTSLNLCPLEITASGYRCPRATIWWYFVGCCHRFVPAEHAWRKVERRARKLFMFAVESMPVASIINFLSRELQLTS